MAELNAHGIAVEVPPTWEGRIFVRPQVGEVATQEYEGRPAPPGEQTYPLLHLASVPLPADVGDYGSAVVETLTATDIFIVLKEFSPASVTTKMFARRGMPLPLDPAEFSPSSLQRTLPGQAGVQVFYNDRGRAYCLYVVIGSHARRDELARQASAVLAGVSVEPR